MKRMILALIFMGCSVPAFAQENFEKSVDALIADLPSSEAMTKPFHGYVWVRDGGKVVYSDGVSSVGEAPTADSNFAIGSVTKHLVGAELARLEREGVLNLSDKISKYVKQLPEWSKDVTLEQLANHTSGFANYTANPKFKEIQSKPLGLSDILALSLPKSPAFPAGSKWSYSNTNYYLLGVVIEKVTGKSFVDQMHEGVFKDAGLPDVSSFENRKMLTGLEYRGDKATAIPLPHVSGPAAAGAMAMSPNELAAWGDYLLSQPELLRRMSQTSTQNAYGLGLFVDEEGDWRHHGGGIDGFQTYFAFNVKTKDMVIVLGTCLGCGVHEIGSRIKKAVSYGKPIEKPAAVMVISKEDAMPLVGKYVLTEESGKQARQISPHLETALKTMTLTFDEALMVKAAGQPAFQLNRAGKNMVGPNGIKIEGKRLKNGKFQKLLILQGPLKLEFDRQ